MEHLKNSYLVLLIFAGFMAPSLMAAASTLQYKAVDMEHVPGMRHKNVERISVYLNRQAAQGWVLDKTVVSVGVGLFIFRKNISLAKTKSESADNRSKQHLNTAKSASVLMGPDVSIAGQVAYACALVQRVQNLYGPVDNWGEEGVGGFGNHASATIEAGAIVGLLGAIVGANQRVGFDGSIAKNADVLLTGLQRLDIDRMQEGLDGIATGCAKR